MKTYMKESNSAALNHIDIPDKNKLWCLMHVIWKQKLQLEPEKILLLATFLTIEAWEEVVDSLGSYGPHQRVVNKQQLDANLSKQHRKHFKQAQ
eukprot:15348296-Ditylum_brightwellii.AAC.1